MRGAVVAAAFFLCAPALFAQDAVERERTIRDRENLLRQRQAAANARASAADARFDDSDYDRAAEDAVSSMISSGAVTHPGGGRYVLVISNIENRVGKDFDGERLAKKMRIKLLASGKVVTTTALGPRGPEDTMTKDIQTLKQYRGVEGPTEILPDLSLSGRVFREAGRRIQLQLTLTDVKTGLATWELDRSVRKGASSHE